MRWSSTIHDGQDSMTTSPENTPLGRAPSDLASTGRHRPSRAAREPRPRETATATDTTRPRNDLIGRYCGSYKIVELLGEGGMGQVWRARSDELGGSEAAVKVLLQEVNKRPESLERFHQEVFAIGATQDESVVKVFEAGMLEDGRRYMIMEYCAGGSFASLLARRTEPLSTELVFTILAQAASALAAAHKAGIIHRDFKPGNIMLIERDDGFIRAKLTDFGIAKLMKDRLDHALRTGSQKILGSAGYMAPEQVRAMRDLDHRVDIYAFGTVLYECLTGRRPYLGDSVQELLVSVATNAQFPRPRELRGDIPPELEDVVMECLEHDREKRIQTMEEVVRRFARTIATGAALITYAAPRFAERSAPPTAITISTGIGPAVTQWVSAATASKKVQRRMARRLVALFLLGLVVGSCAVGLLWWKLGSSHGGQASGQAVVLAAATSPREQMTPTSPAAPVAPGTALAAIASVTTTANVPTMPAATKPATAEIAPTLPNTPSKPIAGPARITGARPTEASSAPLPTAPRVSSDQKMLKIRVKPFAEVTIDGVRAGTTPVDRNVKPGKHHVILEGYPSGSDIPKREEFDVDVTAPTTISRIW
jgi:serine/threonine-protein kinase